MTHPFSSKRIGPVNRAMIIIVNICGDGRIKETEIRKYMTKHLEIFHAFVCGFDFCFTGASTNLSFFVKFPKNWTTPYKENVTADRLLYLDREGS